MASNTVINTNVLALTAHRNLGIVGNRQAKANNRLSSGKRINSAADDAAGLAISTKMKAQIRSLDMASKNSEDGMSLVKVADGALEEVGNMMTRMRELAVQSLNGTNTKSDRKQLQEEVSQLQKEITSIFKRTEFNTIKILSKLDSNFVLQIGANQNQNIQLKDFLGTELKLAEFSLDGVKISKPEDASKALSLISKGFSTLSTKRAKLGALQNRLEYTVKNLNVTSENLSAANSRIEDADMAKEMMNLTSANVLQQAATSMLAQANQAPQSITQLLG